MRWLVAIFIALTFVSFVHAQDEDAKATALKDIRSAMSARDLATMKTKLAAAGKLRGEEKFDIELDRLQLLADYITSFWEAVDRAGKNMQAKAGTIQEFVVGETMVLFVEYFDRRLVVRTAGKNHEYVLQNMPYKVALAVAQQELDPKSAANKVYFGAFLLMDGKGDRKLAAKMWEEAGRGGSDVKSLLPELGSEAAAGAVALPAMTPAIKAQLSAKNWSLRTKGPKNWQKKPLATDNASQDADGRLVVTAPSDADAQLVFNRQLAPAFVCRIYLDGVKKGQTIGLVSVDGDEDAMTLALPSGTVFIEFGRQAGQLKARIGGEDVEFAAAEKGNPRMPAILGISLPAGSKLTVASIELGTR
ncbi:hypothetical protein [Anatilimnocola floriformis]|uniref:hypothetical protein n=1 Tax=Anatilimnocola floriformis TaxID=2948575 RepID=UPI0020C40F4A|nr:hypothetical protein [Anatilimnocola floriformis]